MLRFEPRNITILLPTLCLAVLVGSGLAIGPESLSRPRRWNSGKIPIALSTSLLRPSPAIKNGSEIESAVRSSIDVWRQAADVDFRLSQSDLQNISDPKSKGDGTSLITIAATAENVVLFPNSSASPPAITRLFLDRRGAIAEADIVLNPFVQFSTDGSYGTYDLQTVITHELGHLLGLGHSALPSSSMFTDIGVNAANAAFYGRSLSADDIAAVRRIYGTSSLDEICCGSIEGSTAESRSGGGRIVVWAEDGRTGKLAAQVHTDNIGAFSIEGLPNGEYRVFAQGVDKELSPAVELGITQVSVAEVSTLKRAPLRDANLQSLEFIGLNGQLSGLPVVLEPGRTYQLFVGGKLIGFDRITFGINSPFFETENVSDKLLDYGSGISAAVLNVKVLPNAQVGEYSVYIQTAEGQRRYFVGSVVVE